MPAASPVMTAETESNMLLEARPVRLSGWIALLLGLASSLSLLAPGLVVLAVLAIVVGLYAIRGYEGLRPAGYRAAVVGMLLAVLFSSWSVAESKFRNEYMLRHGSQFAADWIGLVQRAELELACELTALPEQRQDASVPLKTYYQESDSGKAMMSSLSEHVVYSELIRAGAAAQWEQIRPAVYRHHANRHVVDTYWRDSTGKVPRRFALTLEYHPAVSPDQIAQWRVSDCNEMLPES